VVEGDAAAVIDSSAGVDPTTMLPHPPVFVPNRPWPIRPQQEGNPCRLLCPDWPNVLPEHRDSPILRLLPYIYVFLDQIEMATRVHDRVVIATVQRAPYLVRQTNPNVMLVLRERQVPNHCQTSRFAPYILYAVQITRRANIMLNINGTCSQRLAALAHPNIKSTIYMIINVPVKMRYLLRGF
jgi:hypothetical protein